jgi:hypothetical protein
MPAACLYENIGGRFFVTNTKIMITNLAGLTFFDIFVPYFYKTKEVLRIVLP